MQQQFSITAADGREILIYGELPKTAARQVLVISHGMAEHIQRYSWFAQQLAEQGIAVYAANHRGHGPDCELAGHYADQAGWQKVVADLHQVIGHVKQQHALPLTLFGHSMGSFIARQYAIRHGEQLDRLILSGSNHQSPWLFRVGLVTARLERLRLGARASSKLLELLSFGSFNQAFKPARTEFDWLSRDAAEVDRYIADPLCGFSCSTQFWCDFFYGLAQISCQPSFRQIPSTLPVMLVSGDKDPVGRQGKGVVALANALSQLSGCATSVKLYPDARHELLNETNKQQVVADILSWLDTAAA